MGYLVVSVVALVVSTLTLFSGFGLGTLLMPAFALFFPVSVAVAVTAVVHFVNNVFKAVLIGKYADWRVLALFAIPAAALAVPGALLLNRLAHAAPIARYTMAGSQREVTILNVVIATLIAVFAVFELVPRFREWAVERKYIPFGGALSGFLGGLSGLQGALRAAFLIKAGLSKEAYIATSALSAVVVDASRLVVYGVTFFGRDFKTLAGRGAGGFIIAGIAAALVGSLVGVRLMKKATLRAVEAIVGVLLLISAALLAAGLV